jgi:L-threonylcarbamoyladenylate synthase
METMVIKVNQGDNDDAAYQQAAQILKAGGLVAFPTETVYGLGANGMDDGAAGRIYAAKGRPSDNPLILHIAEWGQMNGLVKAVPEEAKLLAKKFWPGPLTMVFWKADAVPYAVTGGLDTVAVRMPDHPSALRLIRQAGMAVAAPSANTSGRPSPTRAEHVIEDLAGKIDLILDGGVVGVGIESTILDMTVLPPSILRPGFVTREMLSEVLEAVEIDPALEIGTDTQRPKAPGMKYRHYAPKAVMFVVEGAPEEAAHEIRRMAEEKESRGYSVGIIGSAEYEHIYQGKLYKIIGSRDREETIAHNLYDVLRGFDALSVDYIYSESFTGGEFGQAVMNRLRKAAGQRIISVGKS